MVNKDEAKITDKMGATLKHKRNELGLTRDTVAERAGIGIRHLAAIENEKRMPSAEVLCRIIRALGISANLIAYPENEEIESEDAHLVRLIRTCDVRDRRAVKAMVEALAFSRKLDNSEQST